MKDEKYFLIYTHSVLDLGVVIEIKNDLILASSTMKNFHLSLGQVKELRAAHRAERNRNANAACKINAVILLGTGWKIKNVKEALRSGVPLIRLVSAMASGVLIDNLRGRQGK